MDLSKLKDKICNLTKESISKLSDEELLKTQKEGHVLWSNGIKFRETLDLLLEENLMRSRKKAIKYTDDEVLRIIVNSIGDRLKNLDTGFKVELTAEMLKDYLNNSGGTLSNKDGFSIGSVMYSSKGGRALIYDSPYEVKSFNNNDSVINSFDNERYREIIFTYCELCKLILIIGNTKELHEEMKLNNGYVDDIKITVDGQLSLM